MMNADPPLPPECSRVVVTHAEIAARVHDLGETLTHAYEGEDVRLVTVLKGGAFFLADLCRAMDCPLRLDFMSVAQYVPGQGGAVRVTKDLDDDVAGARVLLVEDIVDTGLTVNYVLGLIRARDAASVEVCALFDKPARRIAEVPIAYRGFELSDRFLVGYGLDLGGKYRNLPYVAELRDEVVFG